jgi:hypothetical protein
VGAFFIYIPFTCQSTAELGQNSKKAVVNQLPKTMYKKNLVGRKLLGKGSVWPNV